MRALMANRAYRRMFGAQLIALSGTGLATVALSLVAYDLAGADAGAVLGTALAIKMIAYVAVAPFAGALAARLPRKVVLVGLDSVRAVIAFALPWVEQVWQVYVLVFALQAASAAFTPTFQATIPDVLPDEDDYTRALSLSRLAHDLESLLSPLLAVVALTLVSHDHLFIGTSIGFAASALLVVSAALPAARPGRGGRALDATARGIRVYLRTPRLRGLFAAHLAVAAAGAMVLVNTVVYVRALLGRDGTDVAVALGVYGSGSLVAALALPRVLRRSTDRAVMVRASALLAAALLLAGLAATGPAAARWPALLVLWAVIGAGASLVLTPAGRLLRRSARPEDRPALFAADFALSHACWLLCYPVAGWLATATTMATTCAVLGVLAAAATALAARLWPAHDPDEVEHEHDLEPDHSHLAGAASTGRRWRHAHPFQVDELHPHWPR